MPFLQQFSSKNNCPIITASSRVLCKRLSHFSWLCTAEEGRVWNNLSWGKHSAGGVQWESTFVLEIQKENFPDPVWFQSLSGLIQDKRVSCLSDTFYFWLGGTETLSWRKYIVHPLCWITEIWNFVKAIKDINSPQIQYFTWWRCWIKVRRSPKIIQMILRFIG